MNRCRHAMYMFLLCLPALAGCGAASTVGEFFQEQVAETQGLVPDGGPGSWSAMSPGERDWAGDVFARTNQMREAAGLDPLVWHEPASLAGYHHAWDMDVRDYFHHVSPDGDEPGDRLAAYEVPWSLVGENIARGQGDRADLMSDWMNSKGHRANILHPEFTHLGVAVHSGPSDGPFWVQVFVK